MTARELVSNCLPVVLSFTAVLAGCGGSSGGSNGGGGTPGISSVTVACSPGSINPNQTSTCSPTVSGIGSYSSSVTWSVSPATIGTVSSAGVFTPSGTGTATITATSTEDSSKSGNATVTVAAQSTITSVSVICTPPAILTTQTSNCTATVQGAGSCSSAVTWEATDGTITSSGVTPSILGTAVIAATSSQDPTKSWTSSISVVNSTTSGAWTWMNGSNSSQAVGFYGTKGVASSSNVPMAAVTRPVGRIRAGISGSSVVMRSELAVQLRRTISGNTTPLPMNGHLWGETQMHVLRSTRRLADTTGPVSIVRKAWPQRIISPADG